MQLPQKFLQWDCFHFWLTGNYMIYIKQPVLTGKDVSPTTDVSVLTIFYFQREPCFRASFWNRLFPFHKPFIIFFICEMAYLTFHHTSITITGTTSFPARTSFRFSQTNALGINSPSRLNTARTSTYTLSITQKHLASPIRGNNLADEPYALLHLIVRGAYPDKRKLFECFGIQTWLGFHPLPDPSFPTFLFSVHS